MFGLRRRAAARAPRGLARAGTARAAAARPVAARAVAARPAAVHTRAAPPPVWQQQRSARLAALYAALARGEPAGVYDAFLGAEAARLPLAAAEYRHVLQVLLEARPHTRQSTDQILVLLEHVKRAQKLYAHATSPSDRLVRDELTALLQDAYVWNALLSSARGRQKRLPLSALAELLDLFVAAEHAVPDAPAHARGRPTFPNVVSYNLLLHAIVRSLPADAGRARAAPATLAAVRREVHAGRYTRTDAEAFFHLVWARLEAADAPSEASWAIRVLLYTQLARLGAVQQSMRACVAAHRCSTAAVNTALGAYAAAHRTDPAMPARVGGVYEALRYNRLLAELGRAPPRVRDDDVHAVLGVDRVPAAVHPDRGTYALLIRLLTQRGDLSGALRVLHDMVVTPGARGAPGTAPGPDVYHAFFAAFARFGVPASVRRRGAAPDAWEWHERTPGGWGVAALAELFEGYLRVQPADAPPRRVRRRRGAVRAPAPSPEALYQVLCALRRVGGAHRAWVATQWARVVDKFADAAHWYGFRVDARLARALEAT